MSAQRMWLALMASLIMAFLSSFGCGGDGTANSTFTSQTEPGGTGTNTDPNPSTGQTPTTSATSGGTTTFKTTGEDSTDTPTSEVTSLTSTDSSETATTGESPCPQGEIVCEDDTAKTCDGMGGFTSEEGCSALCKPGQGCSLCVPGYQCVEGNSQKCAEDGQSWEGGFEVCDSVQGMSCDQDTGQCIGNCSKGVLGINYIGCEYYPTVLSQQNTTHPKFIFGIAVSNTGKEKASLLVERGPVLITQTMVMPQEVKIIELPWVNELAVGTGPSALVKEGAYRLRSDQPVTVYQYNPLEAVDSNDASLLLPVNTWTGNYLVASWPTWQKDPFTLPGFYAVVASQNETKVSLTPPQKGVLVQAGGGVATDGAGMILLQQGDVLQVLTELDGKSDLTGGFVHADKPVQVFGGHNCSNVPLNVEACDHLEESMFPLETLGLEYLVVPPVQTSNDTNHKAQVVRVIAVQDNTALTFDPDQPVQNVLNQAGEFIEIPLSTAFYKIKADKKILVAQYMVGQTGGYGTGDPSMLLAVSEVQWRADYQVHAPISWETNYADLIAKEGTEVMVDDAVVVNWKPIGASGYVYSHVKLTNEENGTHKITGNQPVGVSVYGLQNSGSYWYPGGLDLNLIPQ